MALLSTNLSQKYKCQLRLFSCLLPCSTSNLQLCTFVFLPISQTHSFLSLFFLLSFLLPLLLLLLLISHLLLFHLLSLLICLPFHYSHSYYQILSGLTFAHKEARFHIEQVWIGSSVQGAYDWRNKFEKGTTINTYLL